MPEERIFQYTLDRRVGTRAGFHPVQKKIRNVCSFSRIKTLFLRRKYILKPMKR
jgi:hypothetical protein